MADNLTYTTTVATAPSGTKVLTDDCTTGHAQIVKLGISTDGSATLLTADNTNGLLVQVSNTSLTVASHAVTNAGTFAVQNTPPVATTATLANVSGSASSVTLQASNASRLGLTIYNDSSATLYVKFGSSASATSFTVQLQAGEYWELQTSGCRYTGIVTGIWGSATGAARITELTA